MAHTIIEQCELLKTEMPTRWELRRACEYIKGGILLGLEDCHNVSAWFIREELLETEYMTVKDVIARLESVTPQDVSRVAERIFCDDWVRLAAVGPIHDPKAMTELVTTKHRLNPDVP